MNYLMNLLMQAVTFLTGPFGPAFVTICVIIALLASAAHWAPRGTGLVVMFLGAAGLSGAWLVRTLIGGGGGI